MQVLVLDVTALAFVHIVNTRETGPSETDWIVISLEKVLATSQAGFVYFGSCFENVNTRRSRDMVPDMV